MSACDNFVDNLWRKGKCSNCFQPLTSHRGLSDERSRRSDNNFVSRAKGALNGQANHKNSSQGNNLPHLDSKREKYTGGDTNLDKAQTSMRETAKDSVQKCEVQKYVTVEGKDCKPALKPVPKPRQRASSALIVCDQNEDLCCEQTSLDVESEVLTELRGDSKDRKSDPDANNFNVTEITVESGVTFSPETNGRYGETETPTIEFSAIPSDDGQKCTFVSDEINMGSMKTHSSQMASRSETESEEEYVPMRNNVFDMNMVIESADNYRADVLVNEDKTRNKSATSSTASDDVFNSAGVTSTGSQDKHVRDCEDQASKGLIQGNGFRDEKPAITSTSHVPNHAERFYVNRPVSVASERSTSSSESAKESCNSSSSNNSSSMRIPQNGLARREVQQSAPILSVDSGKSTGESSDSSSSWGSSTWDSCSASDFHENSAEGIGVGGLLSSKGGLKEFKIKSTAHESFATKARNRRSNPDIKEQIPEGPIYINAGVRPITKPYKVVDISTGLLVSGDQDDTPPLPPKEKDLALESIPHDYMEPPEVPDKGGFTGGFDNSRVRGGRPDDVLDPSESPPPISLPDKTGFVRRTPAPRPRSRISSQCGTLPKPVPRASKVFSEGRSEKENEKDNMHTGKMNYYDTNNMLVYLKGCLPYS